MTSSSRSPGYWTKFFAEEATGEPGAWEAQIAALPTSKGKPRRTANGMDRARDLLWSGLLSPEEKMVWEMYCDGAGEREIATTLGISRRALSRRYMQRLKGLAGMEVDDAYRYRSKRAASRVPRRA